MIYPKFTQRYLAAIVLCLIFTLGALGALFLIYLFNEGRLPLVLSADRKDGTGTAAATRLTAAEKQQQEQRERHIQLQKHVATPTTPTQNNDENGPVQFLQNNAFEDRKNHSTEQENDDAEYYEEKQQQHILQQKQQQQRFINNMKLNLQRMITTVDYGDSNKVNHNNNKGDSNSNIQEKRLQLMPHRSKNPKHSFESNDGDFSYTKEHFIGVDVEDDDDDDYGVKDDISLTEISGRPSPRQEQHEPNLDTFDTIYIDDIERPCSIDKNNMHDQHNLLQVVTDDDELVDTDITNITYFDVELNEETDAGKNAITKQQNEAINHNKVTKETTATNTNTYVDVKNKLLLTKQRRTDQPWIKNKDYIKRPLQKQRQKQKRQQHINHLKRLQIAAVNLDKLYDNSYDIVVNDDYADDDDDNDDANMAGSGSGDSSVNSHRHKHINALYNGDNDFDDDIAVDDTEMAEFIKRISLKMLQASRKNQKQLKSNTPHKNRNSQKQHQQQLVTERLHINNETHSKTSKMFLQHFSNPVNNEIVSNHSALQLFINENKFLSSGVPSTTEVTTVAATTASLNLKNHSSDETRDPLLRTTAETSTETASDLSRSNVNSNLKKTNQQTYPIGINFAYPAVAAAVVISAELAFTTDVTHNTSSGGGNDNDSSPTWLETRTRRLIGNVKKSEERSRQLLLCEEAGGGELCRMLFKGPLNE